MRIAPRAFIVFALLFQSACESEPEPEWSPLFDDLDRVLLSAWGPSVDDLWMVGGPLGAPGDALALHHDGERWTEHPTGTRDTFWWVWGASSDDVFFVGENGAIHRWNGVAIESMESPVTDTLFGVWGSSASDVWAVGGDPLGSGERGIVLHYDGSSWARVDIGDALPGAVFKVWGSAANDVWAVGQGGMILHFDGAGWSLVDASVATTLFTVTGTAQDDVWAVGGAPPTVLHFDGVSWTRVENPGLAAVLSGVAVANDGTVLIVGANGTKWRRTPEGEWLDEFDIPPFLDLHAAWLDPEGRDGVIVGGNYNAPAASMRVGVASYFGSEAPLVRVGSEP